MEMKKELKIFEGRFRITKTRMTTMTISSLFGESYLTKISSNYIHKRFSNIFFNPDGVQISGEIYVQINMAVKIKKKIGKHLLVIIKKKTVLWNI